jgi:hypothetical protein
MSLAPEEFEWSFKPQVTNSGLHGSQNDWNQTLMSKFNQILDYNFVGFDQNIDYFVVPEKYRRLIESIEYYNDGVYESSLFGDVKIIFSRDEKDILLVFPDYMFAKAKLVIKDYIEDYGKK